MRYALMVLICGVALLGCGSDTAGRSERQVDAVPRESALDEPAPARTATKLTRPPVESPGIVYLDPADVDGLPPHVVGALQDAGCTIPQTWQGWFEGLSNVDEGDFDADDFSDWTALCSDGESSRILVVWGAEPSCASEFGEQADRSYVTVMDGEVAFARRIAAAGPNGRYLVHIFEGKGGVRYACEGGRWSESMASD